tara:strand:+ start:20730 stop:22658 length:1929 start_codon:yes stop_codon:yes gene_type:complete
MPITMAHAGSPGLVGGAAFGGSLMRNRRKYGLQAAQFADRAIQRRDQRLKYAIDRRDRLADRQDRIQLSLMGQAAADARQQSANNLRRELAVGDATTRFMLANQADERARLTQKGYAERQEDQQAFLEQQQRQKSQAAWDKEVRDKVASGEWALPQAATIGLQKVADARAKLAGSNESAKKKAEQGELLDAQERELWRTARPTNTPTQVEAFNARTIWYNAKTGHAMSPTDGSPPRGYAVRRTNDEGELLPFEDSDGQGTRSGGKGNVARDWIMQQVSEGEPIDAITKGLAKLRKLLNEADRTANAEALGLPPLDEIEAMLERIKGDRAEGTATRWWQAVQDGHEPEIGDDMTPGRLWRLDKNKIIDLDLTPGLKNTVRQAKDEEERLKRYGLSSASIGGRSTLYKKQQPVPGTEEASAGSEGIGPAEDISEAHRTPPIGLDPESISHIWKSAGADVQRRDNMLKSQRKQWFQQVLADLDAGDITTKQAEGYLNLMADDVHREAQMERAVHQISTGQLDLDLEKFTPELVQKVLDKRSGSKEEKAWRAERDALAEMSDTNVQAAWATWKRIFAKYGAKNEEEGRLPGPPAGSVAEDAFGKAVGVLQKAGFNLDPEPEPNNKKTSSQKVGEDRVIPSGWGHWY